MLMMLQVLMTPAAHAVVLSNESLHYTITYKWGLIHKDAGKATLRLQNVGDNYRLQLTARTLPWADKIFEVRDTLRGVAQKSPFRPLQYEKITHEGKKYGKDVISFSYGGSTVKGTARRVRQGKDGKFSNSSMTLHATGPTFDMLSIFYYLRILDFNSMKPGHSYRATVFSGTKAETLTISNLGIETIKMRNKSKRQAYHLRFSFTRDGRKKSSSDMNAWISTDASRIPLYLTGELPVGQVRVYLD